MLSPTYGRKSPSFGAAIMAHVKCRLSRRPARSCGVLSCAYCFYAALTLFCFLALAGFTLATFVGFTFARFVGFAFFVVVGFAAAVIGDVVAPFA